jgi:hypothetical protein
MQASYAMPILDIVVFIKGILNFDVVVFSIWVITTELVGK